MDERCSCGVNEEKIGSQDEAVYVRRELMQECSETREAQCWA